MTMALYSGTPGSGKSLHATQVIGKRLKRGLPVIANYNLDRSVIPHAELFTYMDNDVLRVEALEEYARGWFGTHKFGEDKILLVIDECQIPTPVQFEGMAECGQNELAEVLLTAQKARI